MPTNLLIIAKNFNEEKEKLLLIIPILFKIIPFLNTYKTFKQNNNKIKIIIYNL